MKDGLYSVDAVAKVINDYTAKRSISSNPLQCLFRHDECLRGELPYVLYLVRAYFLILDSTERTAGKQCFSGTIMKTMAGVFVSRGEASLSEISDLDKKNIEDVVEHFWGWSWSDYARLIHNTLPYKNANVDSCIPCDAIEAYYKKGLE